MYKYTTDVGAGPAPETLQSLDELAREGARRMIAATETRTGARAKGSVSCICALSSPRL